MDLDTPHPQHVTQIHHPHSPTTPLPESPESAGAATTTVKAASPKSGRHPVFKGIRCRSGKWVSEIREPKKTTRIWLGTYATAEMAAAAYDVATLALKGPDAAVNFPHLASCYPVPASQGSADIRAAAACAAAAAAAPGLVKCGGVGEVQIQIATLIDAAAKDNIGDQMEITAEETEPFSSPNDSPVEEASFSEAERTPNDGGGDETLALLIPSETEAVTGKAPEKFVDEEELFEMPKLLEEMAEGMLMSPPRLKSAAYEEDQPPESDDNLWSYSPL